MFGELKDNSYLCNISNSQTKTSMGKRFFLLFSLVMVSVLAVTAQQETTKQDEHVTIPILNIPIDGSSKDFLEKIKTKGYSYHTLEEMKNVIESDVNFIDGEKYTLSISTTNNNDAIDANNKVVSVIMEKKISKKESYQSLCNKAKAVIEQSFPNYQKTLVFKNMDIPEEESEIIYEGPNGKIDMFLYCVDTIKAIEIEFIDNINAQEKINTFDNYKFIGELGQSFHEVRIYFEKGCATIIGLYDDFNFCIRAWGNDYRMLRDLGTIDVDYDDTERFVIYMFLCIRDMKKGNTVLLNTYNKKEVVERIYEETQKKIERERAEILAQQQKQQRIQQEQKKKKQQQEQQRIQQVMSSPTSMIYEVMRQMFFTKDEREMIDKALPREMQEKVAEGVINSTGSAIRNTPTIEEQYKRWGY